MPPKVTAQTVDELEGIYTGLVGLFIALALTKWGNPVIMDAQIAVPSSYLEFVFAPWPMAWAYRFALVVLFGGLFFARNVTGIPKWWLMLPVFWLGWQIISAFFTIDPTLSWMTVPHFGVAVAMFFIGVYSFSRFTRLGPFWVGLVGGFIVILLIGLRQHFGGLEETRRFLYSLPDWRELPPEFLQKIGGNRIYSTLVYPNTFAGALLLLTPISLACLASVLGKSSAIIRWFVMASILALSAGCLYWSGSKAGWLIAMIQIGGGLLRLKSSRGLRVCFLAGLLALGFVAFGFKYRDYFERGATSVSARLDYWRAAWITIKEFPVLGSGPGSFMVRYKNLKDPKSEMTRLAHNDYLQQASDSGVAGGLAFLAFWAVGLGLLYRKSGGDRLTYSVFLGLFGVVVQGFVEFGLYIPAISWPSWFLLGWLVARGNRVDKPFPHS